MGIESENITIDTEFWNKFLNDNPNYIPGWLEIGRVDKVNELDPNYLISNK